MWVWKKGNNFKDRTSGCIEKATEMKALENMWFIWEETDNPAFGNSRP